MESQSDSMRMEISRMQDMLSRYYGPGDSSTENEVDGAEDLVTNSIDSAHFDASEYVQDLLQKQPLTALLEKDGKLVQEVKKLDSEMKTLVHENYKKFISATETIRQMKDNVEEMESKITKLVSNMNSIYTKADEITQKLSPNRSQIEKLVSVRGLLKKLEFLFELPLRLTRAIELQAYVQAVQYYTKAHGVLQSHSHVPSLKAILLEAETIMSELKGNLRSWIRNDFLAGDKLAEYIKLLLQLEEAILPLHQHFLQWQTRRFGRELGPLQPDPGNVTADDNAKSKQLYSTLSSNEYISALNACVAGGLSDVCDRHEELFGTDKAFQEPLVAMARDVFAKYFKLCRAKMTGSMQGKAVDVSTLRAALEKMRAGVMPMHNRLPKLRLSDRVVETVENAMRYQVSESFSALRESSLERILSAFEPSQIAKNTLVSRTVEVIVEMAKKTLGQLHPLIEVGRVHLGDMNMGRVFADLVQGQLNDFFLWLNNLMAALVQPNHDTREMDEMSKYVASTGGASAGSGAASKSVETLHHHLLKVDLPDAALKRMHGVPAQQFGQQVLLLAAMCKQLCAKGIDKCFVTWSLQQTNGQSGQSELEFLKTRTKVTEQTLLRAYIKRSALLLSQCVEEEVRDLEPAQTPTAVSALCSNIMVTAQRMSEEVNAVLGLGPFEGEPLKDAGMMGSDAILTRPGLGHSGERNNAGMLDRLFSKKLQMFDEKSDVAFGHAALVSATLTVALKSWSEHIRRAVLNVENCQQILVDVSFVRLTLPRFCRDLTVLHSLCKDIVDSAWSRTERKSSTDSDLIARGTVEALCNRKQEELGWK